MSTKVLIFSFFLLFLTGCGARLPADISTTDTVGVIDVTDSAQQNVSVQAPPQTVLALSSSIAEIWLLAGGSLTGVTDDAIGERGLDLQNDIALLGTVKDPSVENILALQPDFVLLSQDIASHLNVSEILRQTGIPHYMARVDTLEEYIKVLKDFTQITGSAENFKLNGEIISTEVETLLSLLNEEKQEQNVTALFLRAYSTGVKTKAKDHTVCTILEDIGVTNIAAKEGFPLEDLSIEAILEADPDYILVVPMGEEAAAIESLEASLLSNPAFAGLSAIQNGRLVMLPKDLYHYKPNNRWGEAYENILKIIYPQIFTEN